MIAHEACRFSDASVGPLVCSSRGLVDLVVTDLATLAECLSAFIVVTNSDAALAAKSIGPEAFNGRRP